MLTSVDCDIFIHMPNSKRGGDERDESGRFAPSVSDQEILNTVREREPAGTAEIADAVGLKRQGVDYRLRKLADAGEVEKKKVGGALIWSIRDPTPHDTGRQTSSPEPPTSPVSESPPSTEPDARDGDLVEDVREHLEGTDQPPKTSHGRGVVLDVFQLLREHGTMKTSELQDAIYPDYADNWGSARAMWNAVDRYLEDVPGVEKGGYGEWAYSGDQSVREAINGDSGDVYDPTAEF